jgi:hypothetical protein
MLAVGGFRAPKRARRVGPGYECRLSDPAGPPRRESALAVPLASLLRSSVVLIAVS